MNYPNYCRPCIVLIATALCFIVPQILSAQPWIEVDKLSASDKASSDLLGASGRVDISGTSAIVGVPFKQADSEENAGRVYIFEMDSITGQWAQTDLILAPDRKAQDAFGTSVAISGDFAVIGANGVNDDVNGENELESAGAAYIYRRAKDGDWNFQQKIVPSERKEFDRFGMGVEIDGIHVVVGAIGNDKDAEGNDFMSGAGAAFIFTFDDTETWVELTKIVASNRGPNDQFGFPLAMNGGHIMVGAPRKKHGGVEDAGNVYLFDADTNGIWTETQFFSSVYPSENAQFGNSLSIYGNSVIIGEHRADVDGGNDNALNDAGLAYIYQKDTNSVWSFAQTVEASDRSGNDLFGSSVAISKDYALVSAVQQNTDSEGSNALNDAGAVYVYGSDTEGNWSQIQKTVAADRADFAGFGSEVSVDGDLVAIGSSRAAADGVLFAGAMYIFEQCNTASVVDVSACDTYTSPGGNQIDSSGTYVEIIPNVAGCDSVITINLAILRSTTSTESVSDCESFTVPSGDTTFVESGSYADTIANTVGCDSVIAFDITIFVVDTSVIQSGDTLTANAIDATYQWVDCTSGLDIAGATDRVFIPDASGVFSVVITDLNGCSEVSACFTVIATGLRELNSFPTQISLFPNPTSGKFTIDLGREYDELKVSVKNINGQDIEVNEEGFSQLSTVDISNMPAGVYFIEIKSGKYMKTMRIYKE
jgi:Secretion system C-terminal sorting domain/FG-GAP repeat